MGVDKNKRTLFARGLRENVQTLTSASTATRIEPTGVTLINSTGGNKTFKFAQRPTKGDRKILVVDINSTGEVTVGQASTAVTFKGTTNGTILFTTVGSAALAKRVELIGLSSAQWIVHVQSTAITLSA